VQDEDVSHVTAGLEATVTRVDASGPGVARQVYWEPLRKYLS